MSLRAVDHARGSVVFFIPELNAGGSQKVLVNVANGFARRSYAVTVLVMHRGGAVRQELDSSVRVVDLDCSWLTVIPRLVIYVHRHRPTVIWAFYNAFTMFPILAATLVSSGTQVIPTVHVRVTDILQQSPSILLRWAYRLVIPLWRRSARIIAVSQAVSDDLQAYGISASQIETIYNPVLTPTFETRRNQLSSATMEIGSWSVPIILGVGRLEHQKNFAALIRAFAMVHATTPSQLVIVGEGSERPQLTRLLSSLGVESAVLMPGHLNDPLPWMNRARVLVVPSRYEGLGLVAIEALAVGTPVIAYDDLPVKEIHAQGLLHLIPRRGPKELADALMDVLSRPTPCPDSIHPDLALQFSEGSVLDRYERIFRDRLRSCRQELSVSKGELRP